MKLRAVPNGNLAKYLVEPRSLDRHPNFEERKTGEIRTTGGERDTPHVSLCCL